MDMKHALQHAVQHEMMHIKIKQQLQHQRLMEAIKNGNKSAKEFAIAEIGKTAEEPKKVAQAAIATGIGFALLNMLLR